jgi:hypothetical protein
VVRQATTELAEVAALRQRVAEVEADNGTLRQKLAERRNLIATLNRERRARAR